MTHDAARRTPSPPARRSGGRVRVEPDGTPRASHPHVHATFASLVAPGGRAPLPSGARLRLDPDWREEAVLWRRGYRLVAGIDEVGRGCLAGPVVAAAVILPPGWAPRGLRESKLLDAPARERLADAIRGRAVAWSLGVVEAELIDRIDILQSTLLASMLAAARLPVHPDALLLDSLHLPGIGLHQRTLVDADRRCASVAAASVVAKVARDRMMTEYAVRYPGYGFEAHKGYASAVHREAIVRLGVCPIHRRTFASCVDVPTADQLALWEAAAMQDAEDSVGPEHDTEGTRAPER